MTYNTPPAGGQDRSSTAASSDLPVFVVCPRCSVHVALPQRLKSWPFTRCDECGAQMQLSVEGSPRLVEEVMVGGVTSTKRLEPGLCSHKASNNAGFKGTPFTIHHSPRLKDEKTPIADPANKASAHERDRDLPGDLSRTDGKALPQEKDAPVAQGPEEIGKSYLRNVLKRLEDDVAEVAKPRSRIAPELVAPTPSLMEHGVAPGEPLREEATLEEDPVALLRRQRRQRAWGAVAITLSLMLLAVWMIAFGEQGSVLPAALENNARVKQSSHARSPSKEQGEEVAHELKKEHPRKPKESPSIPNKNKISVRSKKKFKATAVARRLQASRSEPKAIQHIDLDAAAQRYFEQGVLLFRQRQLEEAIAAFTQAVVANPDFADAYRYMGMTHTLQEDFRAATVAFRRFLMIEPRSEFAPQIKQIVQEYSEYYSSDSSS